MNSNIILVKNDYKLNSFEVKMREIFPPSSRINVKAKDYDMELKVMRKTKPILTDVWLVEIEGGIREDILPSILNTNNVCLVKCNNKNKAMEISEFLTRQKIEFSYLDDTNQSKKDMEDFVMKELKIDRILASYLCNKVNYYMPNIAENVFTLKTVDKITKEVIDKYVSKSLFVSYYIILNLVLGIGIDDVKKRQTMKNKVIKMLDAYPSVYPSVLKFLNKELEKYYEVFMVIYRGELHYDNLYTYKSDNKVIKDIKRTQLKRILDLYSEVSIEKLDYTRLKVSKLSKSSLTIHNLLYLFH